ncbi:MAG: hypothetical protein RMJ66_08360, partial [Bacteroidia bacterium]|nr:hypothetical protein [Bacteroidia bacterium]
PPPPSCPPACALPDLRPGYYEVPFGQTRCIPSNTILTTTLPFYIREGATLIICGQLNLNGDLYPAPNSSIYIAPGAELNVSGQMGLTSTGVTVHNYGTVTIGGSLFINASTYFYNFGSGASLQVREIGVNGGILGLYGARVSVTGGNLWLNSGNICMRGGGCLSIQGSFSNSASKWNLVVGTEPVVFNFAGANAWLNQPLTNSSDLHACVAPGSNVWGFWGNAQVHNNCTQGCGVLPYALLSVSGRMEGAERVYLQWELKGANIVPAKYRVYQRGTSGYALVAETEQMWAYAPVLGEAPCFSE